LIYFLHNPRGKAVKIGVSGAPHLRIRVLRTASPDHLEFLGSVPGEAPEEAELHVKFAAYRIRGEWFRDDPFVLSTIETILRLGTIPRDEDPSPELGDSDPVASGSSDFPVGLFFHSHDTGGAIDWQGRVLRVNATSALVQLFSWVDGSPSVQRIVPIDSLYSWSFYPSVKQMRLAYCRKSGISPREIEGSERIHEAIERLQWGKG
jgi:hypothetical protein